MQERHVSLLSLLVIIFGMIALIITILAITQSTGFRIKAEKLAVLLVSGNPSEVTKNNTFSVNLDVEAPSTPIQTVYISLTYPTNKLDILSTDTNHSSFDVDAGTFSKNGYVSIGRTTAFPRSGHIHIATLTFLAKDTVSLRDIQSAPGTSILNTENRNIYLQTVTASSQESSDSPSVIQFVVNIVENLFSRQRK